MGNSAGKNAVLYPNGGHQYPLDVPLVDKGQQSHLWASPPQIDPTSWDWFITQVSFKVCPALDLAYRPLGVYGPVAFNFVKYHRLLHFLNLKAGSNISDSLKEYMPTNGFDGDINNTIWEYPDPKFVQVFTWTAQPQYALSGIQFKYTKVTPPIFPYPNKINILF